VGSCESVAWENVPLWMSSSHARTFFVILRVKLREGERGVFVLISWMYPNSEPEELRGREWKIDLGEELRRWDKWRIV